MKKIYFIILSLIIIAGALCFVIFNNNEKSDLKKIRVAEVTRSIFYAPQYVAIEEGYFEEEGLDVELILTPGADKVMAAVLSNDVEIGFSGSEATIYVYNRGEEDYVQTFAGLTKRDGSFLVSRIKYDNFTLEDLKGKYIIGGRAGGMPEMTLEWALKQNGIDPEKDVTIDTSIAFASMDGAFIGGTGDFVALFEPNALNIEKEGHGYVVASLGEIGGEVPYTAYNARKSYIKENPDVIEGFSNAINKGLEFVKNNDSETIAKSIVEFFPDTSISDLTKIVERYKQIDSWKSNINITESEWQHINEIVKEAGELEKEAPFNDLIYTKYFK